jgi:hypothetical protein
MRNGLWQALHRRVSRTLDERRDSLGSAVDDPAARAALAEHVANDVWSHVAAIVAEDSHTVASVTQPSGNGFGRWWREQRDNPPVASMAAAASGWPLVTACAFVGAHSDPARGVNVDAGLYEFFTADGAHVYLHDTHCLGLSYRPGPQPVLTAEFAYNREWVPPELTGQPVIVLRFLGAHLLSWHTDPDEANTYRDDSVPGGQVSDLSWDGARTFTLTLLTVTVTLTAHTVEVSTRPL